MKENLTTQIKPRKKRMVGKAKKACLNCKKVTTDSHDLFPIKSKFTKTNQIKFHKKKNQGHRKCDDKRPCSNCVRTNKLCKDVPKFELIKKEKKIKKSEVEGLIQEIIEIQKEIQEIDEMNLPDEIHEFDPIELFQFKENYLNQIPPIYNPINCKKAGTMFVVGLYNKNLNSNEYNSRNFIIQNISDSLSLPFFKRYPSEMVGKELSIFSPNYSQQTFSSYGKVNKNTNQKQFFFFQL